MIICFSGFFSILLGFLILKLIEFDSIKVVWGLCFSFIFGLLLMSLFFYNKYSNLISK